MTTIGNGYVMVWDGREYDGWRDPTTGALHPITPWLVVREMRGVSGVSVRRMDGTELIRNAGSDGGLFRQQRRQLSDGSHAVTTRRDPRIRARLFRVESLSPWHVRPLHRLAPIGPATD